VRAAVDAILGADAWDAPRRWGQPLLTFPTPGPWRLPAAAWHLDFPVRPGLGSRFATRALVLLTEVDPGGGGTVLLEGSHQLAVRGGAGRSADVRRRLARQHPWLADLFRRKGGAADRTRRFMEEGARLDGVGVRVVEVTGEPGDVVFFHPWLLHAAAPDVHQAPRMMVGESLTTRAAAGLHRPEDANA
jgi:ectoine hydroxylase-related dioxygenase (phytanoyl-CoA dioxygenase family)